MNQSNEPVVEVCSKEGALSPSPTYSNGPGSLPCHSKLGSTHCIDRIKKTLIQKDSEKHNWKSFLKAFGKEGSETDRKSLNLKQDNQHGHHPYSKTLSKYPDRWVARKGHIRDGVCVILSSGSQDRRGHEKHKKKLEISFFYSPSCPSSLISSFLPLLLLLSSFTLSAKQVFLFGPSCLELKLLSRPPGCWGGRRAGPPGYKAL